jgi:hypothetical protein
MKRIVPLALVFTLLAVLGYGAVEAQPASAVADTVQVTLNVSEEISITSPADVSMSRNLGVSANTAIGNAVWNVKTNSNDGYSMEVRASTAPAMQSGAFNISDYQTGQPNTWTATSGNAYFGYSALGGDTATATWGTDTDCAAAADVPSATLKYKGFTTTAGTPNIASRTATTTSTGVNTTICFAVEQNNFFIPSGTYTSQVTATAVAN